MTTLQLSLLLLDNSTSSPPDFPVKTFQVPTPTGEGWKVSDLGCSLKSSESFAQFSPDSYCLKTSQPLLTGGLTEFSGKLPKAGLMRNGKLYQRPAWERLTKGNGFSLLPTPNASDINQGSIPVQPENLLTSSTGNLRKKTKSGSNFGMGLARHVALLPTPKAMDGDRGSVGTITRFNNATGRKALKSAIGNLQPDPNQVKGQLNPEFVEWMQGYPLGWTDITPAPSLLESPTTENA
jgi:hypothetical protein